MPTVRGLLKVDPSSNDPAEASFDLAYYRSLTTAQRFRMLVERSVLLLRLAQKNERDRTAPSLSKRR